eukprot:GFYU01001040.1.p1 GENE.GFYU01001040.1~~GFYU01001040.1.p1  ORF type:complete len:222 (+),score=41.19 GFYU01001040.1:42-707(+)
MAGAMGTQGTPAATAAERKQRKELAKARAAAASRYRETTKVDVPEDTPAAKQNANVNNKKAGGVAKRVKVKGRSGGQMKTLPFDIPKIKPKHVLMFLLGIFILMILVSFSEKKVETSSEIEKTMSHTLLERLRSKRLSFTQHATCRMNCRYIDESEVYDILQTGRFVARHSDLDATPCPKYAVEGVTQDKQHVRNIYADCPDDTRVITVIDLDTNHPCPAC